jgi:hypothetical protein
VIAKCDELDSQTGASNIDGIPAVSNQVKEDYYENDSINRAA